MKIIDAFQVFHSSAKPCTRKVQLLFLFCDKIRISNGSRKHAFHKYKARSFFFTPALHFYSNSTCEIVIRSGRMKRWKSALEKIFEFSAENALDFARYARLSQIMLNWSGNFIFVIYEFSRKIYKRTCVFIFFV